jgi:hypothetical protein
MLYNNFSKEFEALKEKVHGKTKTFTIINNTDMKITLLRTNVTHGKRQYLLITKIFNLDVATEIIKDIRYLVEEIKKTYNKFYEPHKTETDDRNELISNLRQHIEKLKDYATVKLIQLF